MTCNEGKVSCTLAPPPAARPPGLRVRGLALLSSIEDVRNVTPRCLSPPRCINGYRLHTAGGNPGVNWQPIQGQGLTILSFAS